MAVPTSYLTGTKNVDEIMEAIQKAGVPSKFTYAFLKDLGYPSSTDRPLIPLFKAMRFIDDASVPLDRYRRFRDKLQARRVVAEGVREAYADVFSVDQKAENLTSEALKGIFARLSGKSDSVAEKMALTFKALAKHGDFSAPAADTVQGSAEDRQPAFDDEQSEGTQAGRLKGLALHHDIHVHLPVSNEVAVYDAIFKALRQNFRD